MGTESRAILFYGVDIDRDDDRNSWITRPPKLPKDLHDMWDDDLLEAMEKWLETAFPAVKLEHHGDMMCGECFSFLHVGELIEQSHGAATRVKLDLKLPSIEKWEQLKKALNALGAPHQVYKKIGWHLALYTG